MSSNNLSNVGASYLYENDDQRTFSREEERDRRRYREGEPGTYRPWEVPHSEADIYKKDPTLPATNHGNQPAKGARIDKALNQDDDLRLKEKGIKSWDE